MKKKPGSFQAEQERLDKESIEAARQAILEVLRYFHTLPEGKECLPKGLPAKVTRTMALGAVTAWIQCRGRQAAENAHPDIVEAMIYGLDFEDAPVECPTCRKKFDTPEGVFG